MTLLIHLGYLAYDEDECEVHIPNLDVAEAFRAAVRLAKWPNAENIIENRQDIRR
ncbi:MAG: hypothetical protein LUE29_03215 [Lachnospiraceae bacterium]|nr:hypothetical protein [Lachnospiraceae bacterium]